MSILCLYHIQGEKGESEAHPNAFRLPLSSESSSDVLLADFVRSFPLAGTSPFHYRFKLPEAAGRDKDLYVDLTRPGDRVPVAGGMITAKVLRMGTWRVLVPVVAVLLLRLLKEAAPREGTITPRTRRELLLRCVVDGSGNTHLSHRAVRTLVFNVRGGPRGVVFRGLGGECLRGLWVVAMGFFSAVSVSRRCLVPLRRRTSRCATVEPAPTLFARICCFSAHA